VAFNNYKDPDSLRLNLMLPSYIIQRGLDRKGFNGTNGGNFICPVCKNSLGLYWEKNANPSRWAINSFGHCPHFGYQGQYPADAAGIELATEGLSSSWENLQNAKKRLIGTSSRYNDEYLEKKKEDEKLKSKRSQMNADLILNDSQWADNISEEGRALLNKRCIDLSILEDDVKEHIGFLKNEKLYYLYNNPEGERYKYPVSAVVFALGEKEEGVFKGFQGRKVNGSDYEKNKKYRFLTSGVSDIFLPKKLECLQDPEFDRCLFITEGPFDCLSYYMKNGTAVSVQGAANLDKIITKLSEILPSCDRCTIVIDFDFDLAGENSSENLIQRIVSLNNNALILRHPGHYLEKDANDFLRSYPNMFSIQLSILNEIARQYKSGIITKKTALTCNAYLHDRPREMWETGVVKFLKDNRDNYANMLPEPVVVELEAEEIENENQTVSE